MNRNECYKKAGLLAALTLCLSLILFAAGAAAETEGDFTYTVSDGCATITGYDGVESTVVVPDTLGGYPVTKIGSNAFAQMSFTGITLPESLISIDNSAFYCCSSLKDISIPEGVTTLGDSVFYDCDSLSEISIPGSVTSIGSYAFYDCSITSVTFGDGSPVISDNAFYLCSNLLKVSASSLSAWVGTEFGNPYANPLYYANGLCIDGEVLTNAAIPEGVTAISSYAFYDYDALTAVSIPDSVTSIGSHAFYSCSGLKGLTLPERIETIGSNAFYGLSTLLEAGISTATAKALGNAGYTFRDPAYPQFTFTYSEAAGVTAAGYTGQETSIVIPEGVECIGSGAFKNSALVSVSLPSTLKSIDVNAFNGCTYLASIVIPEGVASIGRCAFYGCSSLASVTFPSSVKTVGSQAFYRCSSLQEAHAPSLAAWTGMAFEDTYANPLRYASSLYIAGMLLTDAVIPDGVTAINDYAFYGYDKLATLSIPESTVSIGKSAFYDCTSLRLISLHDNIETIGEAAFHYGPGMLYASIGTKTAKAISASGSVFVEREYSSLSLKYDDTLGLCVTNFARDMTSVVVPEGVESINSSVFKNSSITSITLPTTLKSIGSYAFSGCASLTDIHLPDGITRIDSNAFNSCPASIYASVGTATSKILDNSSIAFIDERAPYLSFHYYTNLGWTVTGFDGSVNMVEIPEGVHTIYSNLFEGNAALESASLPNSLRTIQYDAFKSCTGLTHIEIPDNVTIIGSSAFEDCLNLREVTLHEGLETIESCAFDGCTNLPSIEIPASVKKIGWNAFANCLSLSSVTLHEGLEEIGSNAFYRCTALKSISLPGSLITFSGNAFYGSGISLVNLPDLITTFDGFDSNIRFFVSRDSVTANSMATKPNYAVKPFTDPEWGGMSIYYLIDEYTGEKSLQLYKYHRVQDISFRIPDGITGIYQGAFNQYNYSAGIPNNSTLEEIYVPDSVTSIGNGAFANCDALKYVYLPDNLESIGNYIATPGNSAAESPALYCSKNGMTAKKITTDVYRYGFTDPDDPDYSLAYDADGGLVLSAYRGAEKEVIVPDGITAIGERAFYENKTLCDVILPEGVTEIRSAAFQYSSSLSSIFFPSTLQKIGSQAFNGCDALDVLVLPDSLTTLESNSLLCSLEEIHLPDNITSVGTYPFYDSALIFCKEGSTTAKNVSAENTGYRMCDPSNPDWKYRYDENGNLIFGGYRGSATELTIPSIYKGIASYAFSGNDTLRKVVVPDSVTSLGYYALRGNLREIHLPDNITDVNQEAIPSWDNGAVYYVHPDSKTFENLCALGYEFRYCDPDNGEWTCLRKADGSLYAAGYSGKAEELVFPDSVSGIIANFDDNMPHRDLVKTIRIPDSVRVIEHNVFIDCKNLTELYLPDNIENIDTWPFNMHWFEDNLLTIYCSKNSLTGKILAHEEYPFCDPSDPEWLWQYDQNGNLMLGGYRGSKTAITLPTGATAIAEKAFNDSYYPNTERIVSITIPEGYTSIGERAFNLDNLAHISLPSTLRSIGYRAFSGCEFSTIQLPDGLNTIGKNAFAYCWELTSLTIPSSVARITDIITEEDSNLTTVVLPREIEYIAPGAFGESLSTVYCYRGTYAQEWAKDNAPLVRLIGEGTLEDLVELSMPEYYEDDPEYCIFEVGNTFPFMAGISTGTLPFDANYTFTCKSSNPSVARVDSDVLTFLKPGTATITIGIAERPDVAKLTRTIEVFNPVISFTVPDAVFVHIDAEDPAYITPENIEPAKDANPYFRRVDVGDGWWGWQNIEDRGVRFWPEDRLGAIKCEIESFSGVSQPILFVTYDVIGEVYAQAPAKALTVGEIYEPDVTVMVDGAELEKLSYLYTLKSSNTKVAAITEDETIKAVAPGTATITVTARNSGKTAKFTVTVIHSVLLDLPSSLKSIGEEAFAGVSAGEIRIPDGCTSIGARAFAGCKNLYEVTIPASVTEIADDAFDGCSGVNIIAPEGSAGQQAASDNGFTFTAM